MKLLKKYYIYAIELILGNIIFNLIYTVVKTLTFHKIGAANEKLINNLISSFKETIIIFLILYIVSVIIQILYDKSIVKKLNNKLKNQKEGGDYYEK